MRTKTLLLTAAVTLAGIATSMAQVYSQNIVGYVNVTMAPGFNLVANQLNTGTNGANQVLPTIDSSQVLKWTGSSFASYTYDSGFGGWVDINFTPAIPTIKPGEGFFYFNPNPAPTNITLVGEVSMGTNTVPLVGGFSCVSSPVPYAGTATAAPINVPIIEGCQVLKWNGNGYNVATYDSGFGGWVDVNFNAVPAPTVTAGQGFFYFNPNPATTNWTQVF